MRRDNDSDASPPFGDPVDAGNRMAACAKPLLTRDSFAYRESRSRYSIPLDGTGAGERPGTALRPGSSRKKRFSSQQYEPSLSRMNGMPSGTASVSSTLSSIPVILGVP